MPRASSSVPKPSQARRYVAYLRVSTDAQGRSGLGLEAQRAACTAFLASNHGAVLVSEHVEVETGKQNDRPALLAAISEARAYGATLLIAKLDRLSRDAHFLIGLSRSDVVDFVACDNPHANKLTVGIMALVAEQEREAIAERTRSALKAAKARGVKLGNPNGAAHLKQRGNAEARAQVKANADDFAATISPIIARLNASGVTSANAIAAQLNIERIRSARGGTWTARSVLNVVRRK